MPTILYAEDDRDCRELFAFVLRQKGYYVLEANNGAQAVQLVRDDQVDLVILDVRMPLLSGYDAARLIAQEAPQTPVMFLSAKGMGREIDKGFNCGSMVVDYLVKPISNEALLRRVEEVLSGCAIQGIEVVREESRAQFLELRQRV